LKSAPKLFWWWTVTCGGR